MKMTLTDRRPCKMRPGDLRRVPQSPAAKAIAFHVGCPRCGFVTPAIHGDAGLAIEERSEGVTLSRPVRCLMCLVGIRIENSTATLVEGPDVRPVR